MHPTATTNVVISYYAYFNRKNENNPTLKIHGHSITLEIIYISLKIHYSATLRNQIFPIVFVIANRDNGRLPLSRLCHRINYTEFRYHINEQIVFSMNQINIWSQRMNGKLYYIVSHICYKCNALLIFFYLSYLLSPSKIARPPMQLSCAINWANNCKYCHACPFPLTTALTLLMLRTEYFAGNRSISWLLMPWLLSSPGHHQPWYWLY